MSIAKLAAKAFKAWCNILSNPVHYPVIVVFPVIFASIVAFGMFAACTSVIAAWFVFNFIQLIF